MPILKNLNVILNTKQRYYYIVQNYLTVLFHFLRFYYIIFYFVYEIRVFIDLNQCE